METTLEKGLRIKEHWNKEAKVKGGTNELFPMSYGGTYPDYNMQHLEMDSILKYIQKHDRVLDLGCGKGYTPLYFAWKKKINITGLDYAEEMISQADNNLKELLGENQLKGKVNFILGDVLKEDSFPKEQFDLVYTERTLINITTWEDQQRAIENISKLVKKGGYFIMQEGSKTSLDKLNKVREKFGLKPIEVVWHNLMLEDQKLIEYSKKFFDFIKIDNFSSTFTLLSRVINPALVSPKEPSYDSKINSLALDLPNLGDYGYQKIYVFRKPHDSDHVLKPSL